MKKHILVLLIFSFSILEAQEFEPLGAMTFTLYNEPPYIPTTYSGTLADPKFDQTEFIRGWQWGAPPIETDCFNMNMVQDNVVLLFQPT